MNWKKDKTLQEMAVKAIEEGREEIILNGIRDLVNNPAYNFMMGVVREKSNTQKAKLVGEIKSDEALALHNRNFQIIKMLDAQLEMVEHVRQVIKTS